MSTSSKTNRKGYVIFLGAIAAVLVCGVIVVASSYGAYSQWHQSEKIAPRYFVQGENIGGLTPTVAKKHLQKRFGRLFVTVRAPDRDFHLSLSQLGENCNMIMPCDKRKNLDALEISPQICGIFGFPQREKKQRICPLRWNADTLRKTIWTVAYSYNQKPQDAHLEIKNGAAQVVGEQLGRTLNVPEAINTIQQKYFPGLQKVKVTAQKRKSRR